MLCFYCTQTHMKLQSEFSRKFKKNNFRPFAAPSKCRPVRPAPPSLRQCAKFLYYAWICTRHFVATIKSGVLFPPRERRPFITLTQDSNMFVQPANHQINNVFKLLNWCSTSSSSSSSSRISIFSPIL